MTEADLAISCLLASLDKQLAARVAIAKNAAPWCCTVAVNTGSSAYGGRSAQSWRLVHMRDLQFDIECVMQVLTEVLLALNYPGGIGLEPWHVVEKVVPEGL